MLSETVITKINLVKINDTKFALTFGDVNLASIIIDVWRDTVTFRRKLTMQEMKALSDLWSTILDRIDDELGIESEDQ